MAATVTATLASVLFTACGTSSPGGDRPTAGQVSRPTPAPTATCPEAGGTRITFGPDRASGPLYGHGDSAVVLVNQSDRDWCGWFPLPSGLGDMRHPARRYLGFNTGDAGTVADLIAATAELRRRGVRHVVLVGASAGARDALVAATRITPRVDGVMALSAERRDYVLAAVPELRVPTLLVSARTDQWVSGADARRIAASVPYRFRHQVLVDGSLHGIDLAAPPAPPTALRAEAAFLTRYAP